MGLFAKHTDKTAPQGAAEILAKAKERYGFIPNLAAYLAEAPSVLDAALNLSAAFDRTSLTAREQQVVLLTVSALNGCSYCKTVHAALARKAGIDGELIRAVAAFEPLADRKLEALRTFTRKVVDEKGRVEESDIQTFLDAGYAKAQVFEVVMGVAMKTLTNYCNHVAEATPNPEFVAMADGMAPA